MKELVTYKGRLNRLDFFVFGVFIQLLSLVMGVILFKLILSLTGVFDLNEDMIITLPSFAFYLSYLIGQIIAILLTIRRFHDLNRNGFNVLLLLLPFFNLYVIYILLFKKGVNENNHYGEATIQNNYKQWDKKLLLAYFERSQFGVNLLFVSFMSIYLFFSLYCYDVNTIIKMVFSFLNSADKDPIYLIRSVYVPFSSMCLEITFSIIGGILAFYFSKFLRSDLIYMLLLVLTLAILYHLSIYFHTLLGGRYGYPEENLKFYLVGSFFGTFIALGSVFFGTLIIIRVFGLRLVFLLILIPVMQIFVIYYMKFFITKLGMEFPSILFVISSISNSIIYSLLLFFGFYFHLKSKGFILRY